MIAVCRHCSKCKVNRPRGLCWSCYYTPGVKEQFPSTSKYADDARYEGDPRPLEFLRRKHARVGRVNVA